MCSNQKSQNIDLSKLSQNCYIQQISTGCLAQFSYYIESDKQAAIVDPIRESSLYTNILNERGAKLAYILETHFHADFVSGHYELSRSTGAKIVFGPKAKPEFEITNVEDKQKLKLGSVAIQALHTPGHTLESTSYLILDEKDSKEVQLAVFTGDCMFLGEVGRPDLAVKSDVTQEDLAGLLFESIQRLKSLDDSCVVLPAHGAGSACGKNIQSGTMCTIGRQKETNYALNPNLNKKEFIEIVTSNLPTPPQYFFKDVLYNKSSLPSVEEIIKKSMKSFSACEFLSLSSQKQFVILDTRPVEKLWYGYIQGSIGISLKTNYAIMAAKNIDFDQKILLVAEEGEEEESILRLARVGFENVVGYLKGGIDAWKSSKLPISTLRHVKVEEALATAAKEPSRILDVREQSEFSSLGVIEGSLLNSMSSLDISKIPSSGPIAIMCRGGQRATFVATKLQREGFKNELGVIEGGIMELLKNGLTTKKI